MMRASTSFMGKRSSSGGSFKSLEKQNSRSTSLKFIKKNALSEMAGDMDKSEGDGELNSSLLLDSGPNQKSKKKKVGSDGGGNPF